MKFTGFSRFHIPKFLFRILIYGSIFILFILFAFKVSPWPSALLIRYVFEKEAERTNLALEKHVPQGILEILDLQYDIEDKDAKLDIYYPNNTIETGDGLPVIVWIHGGGWISGNKGQTSNYYKILAAKGYVVAAIGYSIAPEKRYPVPVRQTLNALKFLQENAGQFNIDPSSIFLAGDSGGAHIVAQVANIISDSEYAGIIKISSTMDRKKLKGLLLYCGPYSADDMNLEGNFASFLKTVLWSYSGSRDFLNDEYFQTASIINYIGEDFPPSFISAGNGDPLLVHSQILAKKLISLDVKIDTLFFPEYHKPILPHEYQFNLDDDAGRTALKRSLEFLRDHQ